MDKTRLSKFVSILASNQLDAYVLNPGPSFRYLTSLNFHLMERPIILIITPNNLPTIILPKFECDRLEDSITDFNIISYGDNPADWQQAFSEAAIILQINGANIGLEPSRLRVLELDFLKSALPDAIFISSPGVLETLRTIKSSTEIASMRKAVEIAQAAFMAVLPFVKIGVTERVLASEIIIQLLRAGSDTEFPFFPIVASGPNSANPHSEPGNRAIRKGDLVVIDWGAGYNGYFSDLTRTLLIGIPSEKDTLISELVIKANLAAINAARPGMAAGNVDRAAREIITSAGYGGYFTHRTGHGLGLEAHEPPYIYSENNQPLEVGNTHSIEPGIYIPGYGGVRIEDDVVITTHGAESLSNLSRDLWVI